MFLQLKQAGILSNVDRKCDCIIYISFILKIGLFYEAKVKWLHIYLSYIHIEHKDDIRLQTIKEMIKFVPLERRHFS